LPSESRPPEETHDADVRRLVDRCLTGDQAAMAELVERFQSQVFGMCFRMLGQRQDAEDMAQESFVRALRGLRNWDSSRDFAPWLFAIAGNRCRTMLAVRARRPRGVSPVEEQIDPRPDPLAAEALAEEVHRALAGMREDHRQAFLLFHEQQLNYQEIASALGCPVGTAKTWVRRARRELAEVLRGREVLGEANYAL
jgi:RNA polymerase sigma-70 factor (ECF subfamily)